MSPILHVLAPDDPQQGQPIWQRVTNVHAPGGAVSATMYAPDFDPGSDGANSDISAVIGPLTLSPTSVMDFDHFFSAEARFDGGLLEVAKGSPNFNSTPYPDNTTTYDLGNYIPDEVLLPLELEDARTKSEWLSEKRTKKVEVLVGNKKGEEDYYVKTADGPQVYLVKKFNLERINKRPIEWKDKMLCDIAEADLLTQPDAVGFLDQQRVRPSVDCQAVHLLAVNHSANVRASATPSMLPGMTMSLTTRSKACVSIAASADAASRARCTS